MQHPENQYKLCTNAAVISLLAWPLKKNLQSFNGFYTKVPSEGDGTEDVIPLPLRHPEREFVDQPSEGGREGQDNPQSLE